MDKRTMCLSLLSKCLEVKRKTKYIAIFSYHGHVDCVSVSIIDKKSKEEILYTGSLFFNFNAEEIKQLSLRLDELLIGGELHAV
ncbi:hypothetical protein EBB07_00075 [Paenibacillaceae bacterium]|nr:hypothetical protein EBB07_00075 [Paenibacillaceae bacterium]